MQENFKEEGVAASDENDDVADDDDVAAVQRGVSEGHMQPFCAPEKCEFGVGFAVYQRASLYTPYKS
uniref:Uncharacterized protein n=1 Tax=Megaselia scalaris TaxID=36166 RepID=T1GAG7_MEGSC